MSAKENLQSYLEEAERLEAAGKLHERDRFLVMALDLAWQAGKIGEAERIWQRLRRLNPHHFLASYSSLKEVMDEPVIREYLQHVRSALIVSSSTVNAAAPISERQSVAPDTSVSTTAPEILLPLQMRLMQDFALSAADLSSSHPPPGVPVIDSRKDIVSPSSFHQPRKTSSTLSPNLSESRGQSVLVSGNLRKMPSEPRFASSAHCGEVPQDLAGAEPDPSTVDSFSPWVAGTLAVLVLAAGFLILAFLFLAPFWFNLTPR